MCSLKYALSQTLISHFHLTTSQTQQHTSLNLSERQSSSFSTTKPSLFSVSMHSSSNQKSNRTVSLPRSLRNLTNQPRLKTATKTLKSMAISTSQSSSKNAKAREMQSTLVSKKSLKKSNTCLKKLTNQSLNAVEKPRNDLQARASHPKTPIIDKHHSPRCPPTTHYRNRHL